MDKRASSTDYTQQSCHSNRHRTSVGKLLEWTEITNEVLTTYDRAQLLDRKLPSTRDFDRKSRQLFGAQCGALAAIVLWCAMEGFRPWFTVSHCSRRHHNSQHMPEIY